MPLPKIELPIHTLKLPSTNEEIKYRPYTIKEEKILLTAAESKDITDALNSITQVVNNCVLTENFQVDNIPQFDIEYIFMKLRAVSSDNKLSLQYRNTVCPEAKCQDKPISITVDLNDVKVQIASEDHQSFVPFDPKKIKYTKQGKQIILDEKTMVGVQMRFPTLSDLKKADLTKTDVELQDFFILACVGAVFDKNTVTYRSDITDAELTEFYEALPTSSKRKLEEFTNRIPVLRHEVQWCCPVCERKDSIILTGLKDFFG